MRVFAGPNGSGKTTILQEIKKYFNVGVYVNADDIEKELIEQTYIDLEAFKIKEAETKHFQDFVENHSLQEKVKAENYIIDLYLENNRILDPNHETHSYEASLIADYIRQTLVENGTKLTFETVMSHHSKIEFLQQTKKLGYRNYLYFISTESPLINIERVKQRVKAGGHSVSEDKIESRYYKSIELLKEAIPHTYKTFLFDNSADKFRYVLEIFNGQDIIYQQEQIPKWIDDLLFG